MAFLITKAGIDMFMKMKKNIVSITIFGFVFITMIVLKLFDLSFSSIIFILVGGLINMVIYLLSTLKQKEDNKL